MSHLNPAYVVFDGDEDGWSYRLMKGWKVNERVDFDFRDAHDLDGMTARAQSEEYVKTQLRERMAKSGAVLVLIGEKTKNLYKFVRWELELAQQLKLPIIAVNLNESKSQDDRCPPVIRDTCVLHIPFKMKAIKWALDNWPGIYARLTPEEKDKGHRIVSDAVYTNLGL